jgi:hypothetical protein
LDDPKEQAVTPNIARENFDFELSCQDVAAISGPNRDERTGWDPDKVRYVP